MFLGVKRLIVLLLYITIVSLSMWKVKAWLCFFSIELDIYSLCTSIYV